MKLKAVALVVIFISFIVTPTILTSLYEDIDISMAYTVTEEEENHKSFSEVFEDFTSEKNEIIIIPFNSNKERIIWNFLSKHDNISSEIFSPPPEQKLV